MSGTSKPGSWFAITEPKPWELVWNDRFPPLNLWNYKNYMDREYIDAPKLSQAEYDAQVAKKQQWVKDQTIQAMRQDAKLVGAASINVNAIQYGGNHYKSKAIQPWDYVAANNLGYFEGSIIKYVSRWKDKNGIEDLHKARHFLDKLIEVASAKS